MIAWPVATKSHHSGAINSSLCRLFLGVLCILCVLCVIANGTTQTSRNEATVRTSIDRTALFVGDRVTYTIDISCARGVDILADDVSRDKLQLEGLELVASDSERRSEPDGTTILRFRYVLTTYRVDLSSLRIAPLTIRYVVRRAGQPIEGAPPAGDMQAAGATLAFRSVLADGESTGIRADRPPEQRPRRFAVLQSIGLGLVIISIVPAAIAIGALVRRVQRPRTRRSTRAVRRDERTSLDAVQTMALDTIERRREVFTRLDALVRDHLRETCSVPGHSLTPAEIRTSLASSGGTVPSAELVASVLATCEQARYAPPQAMPSADACRQTIQQVEQVIAGR